MLYARFARGRVVRHNLRHFERSDARIVYWKRNNRAQLARLWTFASRSREIFLIHTRYTLRARSCSAAQPTSFRAERRAHSIFET